MIGLGKKNYFALSLKEKLRYDILLLIQQARYDFDKLIMNTNKKRKSMNIFELKLHLEKVDELLINLNDLEYAMLDFHLEYHSEVFKNLFLDYLYSILGHI